jgi:uncharacterized protein YjbI with pentapeptide repeats
LSVCLPVCLSVTGRRSKKKINDQTNAFATQLSSTKVSRGWKFNRSDFWGWEFNRSDFWGWEFNRSDFWGWEFNRADFQWLGIHPIRFSGAGNSANQVLRGWEFSQSGFEGWKFNRVGFHWLGIHSIRF